MRGARCCCLIGALWRCRMADGGGCRIRWTLAPGPPTLEETLLCQDEVPAGGGVDAAGVPVRAQPVPGAGAGTPFARGGGQVRVELGPAAVQAAVRIRAEV